MAAGRYIAAAEIGHHVNARQLGQQGRVVKLHGVTGAVKRLRPMAHGLAVGADGGDQIGGGSSHSKQVVNHRCVDANQRVGRQRRAVNFIGAGAVKRHEFLLQMGGKRRVGMRQNLEFAVVVARKIDQNAVSAVQRGA